MLSMELNLATVVVGLLVAFLAFLAIRRLYRNGMCDCHKDDARGGSCGCSSCGSGCSGCGSVDKMLADMQKASR